MTEQILISSARELNFIARLTHSNQVFHFTIDMFK